MRLDVIAPNQVVGSEHAKNHYFIPEAIFLEAGR